MAIGDGFTSRLLTGMAEHLADAGVGTWDPTGTAYADADTAIVIRAIPDRPDRLITLTAYPVDRNLPGMADHWVGVQVRLRAGPDPRDCDDLADEIFDLLDGARDLTWSEIPVKQLERRSYTSLGQDGSRRWERSENYAVDAMRATANNTD
ncbi:minor capsid protein [Actinoplanes sp. NPDC051861]|uniref:minor capsid protein n=1 Tax=Actinoplanes sp. NPDC051861 TaxID=3155170 RepID=UPI00343C5DBD